MVKIFRNIRQKLAAENSVAKYLRYAVGEIILVVIGILIALQINNWNEQRKERLVEIKYLKNLKHDLQSDSAEIAKYKKIRLDIADAAQKLLSFAKMQQVDDVYKLDSLYISVAIWYDFVPHNNTFNELISSGNLQIIKNDSIKNLLLDLNNENEQLVSARNHMRREYDNYLYDQRAKQISFFDVNDPDEVHSVLEWFYPNRQSILKNPVKLRKNFRMLFNNTMFINGLALATGNNLWIVNVNYANMLNDINKLIELIDQDIKSNE